VFCSAEPLTPFWVSAIARFEFLCGPRGDLVVEDCLEVCEAEPEPITQIQDHVSCGAAEAEQHDGHLITGPFGMRLAVRRNLDVASGRANLL
jgi:hypothetical protein